MKCLLNFFIYNFSILATTRHAILDGMVRVDVFQTSSGRLVVNEIETFEGDYPSLIELNEFVTTRFVVQRWSNILTELLEDNTDS